MKKHFAVLSAVITVLLILASVSSISAFANSETVELSSEQRNAVAMLNYITVLTQDINASKNSRLYMEEAYTSLINNTYPNAVDSRTQSQLSGLLDIMEKYRMIDVKRERLQYIYEQNQAQAIREAIPNPMGLLSAVHSFQPGKLAASIVYMAVDSVSSYMSYNTGTDLQYLKDGWMLDDEEATALHDSRKGTFTYMLSMVRDKSLPGDMTLTENAVEEFVKWKNNDNVVARIQFLESNQKTYAAYGGYWLVLAESYYHHGDYAKCLDAIGKYEDLGTRIFRYDYELAKILPLAISAAREIYTDEEFVPLAVRYAQMITDNTDHDQWALRYFAAQTYVGVYEITQRTDYLRDAYSMMLDNVNYLIEEQQDKNKAYLDAIQTISKPKNATKEEKTEIDKYNTMLKKNRGTELPPVYEPLRLNCDLLFVLAEEMRIPESEQVKVDDILHHNGSMLFLTVPLDRKYQFLQQSEQYNGEDEIAFYGNYMILPAAHVTDDAIITVTVKEKGKAQETIITDWKIDKVDRKKEGDLSTFFVIYNSEDARKYHWKPDSAIAIEVIPKKDAGIAPLTYRYIAVGTKKAWYDYLKPWEGHRNNWYEYAKVWENSVDFERVD